MNRFPRWVYLVIGVASILLYPSVHAVRFYLAAEDFVATAPLVESSLTSAISGIAGKRLVCLRDAVVEGGVTPDDVESSHGQVFRAKDRFGAQLTDEVYEALRFDLDLSRGIRELVAAKNALMDYLGVNAYEEFCRMPRNLLGHVALEREASRTLEEIARVEQEGEPKLREHAAKLEEFRLQFVRARATHEERKWPFRAIAWAAILLEAVGMACTAMVIWASLKRRRGEGG